MDSFPFFPFDGKGRILLYNLRRFNSVPFLSIALNKNSSVMSITQQDKIAAKYHGYKAMISRSLVFLLIAIETLWYTKQKHADIHSKFTTVNPTSKNRFAWLICCVLTSVLRQERTISVTHISKSSMKVSSSAKACFRTKRLMLRYSILDASSRKAI